MVPKSVFWSRRVYRNEARDRLLPGALQQNEHGLFGTAPTADMRSNGLCSFASLKFGKSRFLTLLGWYNVLMLG